MFKNILIPTDGTEFSEKVIADGVTLAKTLGARITVVHVLPAYEINLLGDLGPADEEVLQKIKDTARAAGIKHVDRMEAFAKSQNVPLDRQLLESDNPWTGIIDTAKKKNCDLIMMAAHGRRGLSALVLGSETNKVLTHSTIPVLVYR